MVFSRSTRRSVGPLWKIDVNRGMYTIRFAKVGDWRPCSARSQLFTVELCLASIRQGGSVSTLKTGAAVTGVPLPRAPLPGPAGDRERQSCRLPHHPPQSAHRERPCQSRPVLHPAVPVGALRRLLR